MSINLNEALRIAYYSAIISAVSLRFQDSEPTGFVAEIVGDSLDMGLVRLSDQSPLVKVRFEPDGTMHCAVFGSVHDDAIKIALDDIGVKLGGQIVTVPPNKSKH